jgi:hypothetical protein
LPSTKLAISIEIPEGINNSNKAAVTIEIVMASDILEDKFTSLPIYIDNINADVPNSIKKGENQYHIPVILNSLQSILPHR